MRKIGTRIYHRSSGCISARARSACQEAERLGGKRARAGQRRCAGIRTWCSSSKAAARRRAGGRHRRHPGAQPPDIRDRGRGAGARTRGRSHRDVGRRLGDGLRPGSCELCLRHDITTTDGLDPSAPSSTATAPAWCRPMTARPSRTSPSPRRCRQPFQPDPRLHRHRSAREGHLRPGLARAGDILDPEVCRRGRRQALWLSACIRASTIASRRSSRRSATPIRLGPSGRGSSFLSDALPASKANPDDLDARLNGLLGA